LNLTQAGADLRIIPTKLFYFLTRGFRLMSLLMKKIIRVRLSVGAI
jgi:hypothetical protein